MTLTGYILALCVLLGSLLVLATVGESRARSARGTGVRTLAGLHAPRIAV